MAFLFSSLIYKGVVSVRVKSVEETSLKFALTRHASSLLRRFLFSACVKESDGVKNMSMEGILMKSSVVSLSHLSV